MPSQVNSSSDTIITSANGYTTYINKDKTSGNVNINTNSSASNVIIEKGGLTVGKTALTSGMQLDVSGTIYNTNGRIISNASVVSGKTEFCSMILGPSVLTNSNVGTYIALDNQSQSGGHTYAIGSTGSSDSPGTGCFEIFDVSTNTTRMVNNAPRPSASVTLRILAATSSP